MADGVLEQLQEAEAQPDLAQLCAYLGAVLMTPGELAAAQAACQQQEADRV